MNLVDSLVSYDVMRTVGVRFDLACSAVPFRAVMQRGFCFGVGAVRCVVSARSDVCRCFLRVEVYADSFAFFALPQGPEPFERSHRADIKGTRYRGGGRPDCTIVFQYFTHTIWDLSHIVPKQLEG